MSVDLNLVEAKWRLGLIPASDLHELASNLLDEGLESESLVELFALPSDELVWRGPGVLDSALTELGRRQSTEDAAASTLARNIADRVLDGTLPASEALVQAAEIHVNTGYRFDLFQKLYVLDDEVSSIDAYGTSHLGRSQADIADDVRAEAQRIAAEE